jgi:hypothetical protein
MTTTLNRKIRISPEGCENWPKFEGGEELPEKCLMVCHRNLDKITNPIDTGAFFFVPVKILLCGWFVAKQKTFFDSYEKSDPNNINKLLFDSYINHKDRNEISGFIAFKEEIGRRNQAGWVLKRSSVLKKIVKSVLKTNSISPIDGGDPLTNITETKKEIQDALDKSFLHEYVNL